MNRSASSEQASQATGTEGTGPVESGPGAAGEEKSKVVDAEYEVIDEDGKKE